MKDPEGARAAWAEVCERMGTGTNLNRLETVLGLTVATHYPAVEQVARAIPAMVEKEAVPPDHAGVFIVSEAFTLGIEWGLKLAAVPDIEIDPR